MASKIDFSKLISILKGKYIYILIGASLIVALIMVGFSDSTSESSDIQPTSTSVYVSSLEDRLGSVLGAIEGAGEVKCMITLNGEIERVVAYSNDEKNSSSSNTTTSGATNSSNTSTISKEPILITVNGRTEPLVLYEIMPSIKGIVIVATGADNVRVKLDILKAVQALLNVESSQVEIFTKQSV